MGEKEAVGDSVGVGLPPSMRLDQGIALLNAGDLEAALADFDRALGEDPEMADAYYYRGATHLTLGRNAEAIADLRKYLEIVGLAGEHADEASAFPEYLGSSH